MTPFSDALWVFASNFGDEGTGEQGTSLMLSQNSAGCCPCASSSCILLAGQLRAALSRCLPAAFSCLFFCLFKSF